MFTCVGVLLASDPWPLLSHSDTEGSNQASDRNNGDPLLGYYEYQWSEKIMQ